MQVILNIIKVLIVVLISSHLFTPFDIFPAGVKELRGFSILSNFLIAVLMVDLGIRTIIHFYKRKKNLGAGKYDNVTLGLKNIYYLFLTGALISAILAGFGVDYKTFFTSISIVAAAIAIVSKDYIVDIISGIILSFSSYIKINDYVKVGEEKGRIIDMTLSKTLLLNDEDDIIAISNNKVFTSEITNYTRKASKKVSIDFEINLHALDTIEKLEQELIRSLDDYNKYIVEDSFQFKIVEIHKDSLSLKFQYVLKRMNRPIEKDIRTKTVRRVVNLIMENMDKNRKPEE
ncbi:mechanosensitive ion channel family protein [Membranihabitans marinus]|uniref:mechanosensitive ion channel family protein n=1 Tax=Membranihabitans marinus TaxID=1227546 RepID=UPI001F26D18D|nr:mechanosensitive ion channel family protein [Membranihabitans marinus]